MPTGKMTPRIEKEILQRDPDLAKAIDDEVELDDRQQARLDAWLYGCGYLVDGRRVPPESVVIVRPGGHR